MFGIDPPGSLTGTVLASFPRRNFALAVGAGPQTIARSVQLALPRSTLQEDTGLGDTDEIRVRIRTRSAFRHSSCRTSSRTRSTLLG